MVVGGRVGEWVGCRLKVGPLHNHNLNHNLNLNLNRKPGWLVVLSWYESRGCRGFFVLTQRREGAEKFRGWLWGVGWVRGWSCF